MSRKELLSKLSRIVPPLLEKFHKGQLGRVAVIGGSEDYTGAPYFSAMASARLGCDMSHVICDPVAGAVIKTYDPSLMVHPYLRSSKMLSASSSEKETSSEKGSSSGKESPETAASAIKALFPRLHILILGPGLGRDPSILETAALVITAAREANLPIILDADALYLVQTRPDLVRGYADCVLTPNVVEFARLATALGTPVPDAADAEARRRACEALAAELGVTVCQKGAQDFVCARDGPTLESAGAGARKRCGGQGDTLTGCIGTLMAWRKAYHDGLWPRGEGEGEMGEGETRSLAVWGGSVLTREAARRAFDKFGRSLVAGDLTGEVHGAFAEVVGEPDWGSRL